MEEKREEKEQTKRLSVAPQRYGEESDDSTDIDTRPAETGKRRNADFAFPKQMPVASFQQLMLWLNRKDCERQ